MARKLVLQLQKQQQKLCALDMRAMNGIFFCWVGGFGIDFRVIAGEVVVRG